MANHNVNDVKPTSLSRMIGQKGVVEQVRVALDACQMDGQKYPSSMLVGPAGCGKTQMCHVIAAEMASDVYEVLGSTLTNTSDLFALLLQAKAKDIVYIDEVHAASKDIFVTLLLALDQQKIVLSGKNRSPQSLPLADFTLLMSTTEEYAVPRPLSDRCMLLRFGYYNNEELTTLLLNRVRGLGWDIHEETLPQIAQRSRGTPRLGLRLLQSCFRCCRSEGETTITKRHLLRACELEQLDELGLGPTEQQYLDIVAEGPTRLNVIASRIGLPTRTVSEVTESFLIRVGLIGKDEQGRRCLTEAGHRHLSESP
ncbi:Holliday junction DNA helicase RuvB C-terminal domain-containing protein [Bremerella sp. P1]|uniref:Holliday junction DNA helicase RuvB C-terminal domain-containing protein n=1 Tax=Bremerella sp. P1 TaxID=3026424 RepID=UPI00236780CA|nr:Holliday junction DNA helicase RuvB C-terminal domain-containing protein [Bremerella sp. P1]WDI39870.1 Holliday junction DNA helicase RuvB C-terminal domain-containing protein [Bremerella sp. P1]